MKLNQEHIGKYMTRTGPCNLQNGNEDFSYIGEKMKILSLDDKHIRYANSNWKGILDNRWLDDNWKEYEEIIDIDNLDYNELQLLRDSLKALIRQDIQMNFEYLNRITQLGKKIDEQIRVLQ